MSTTSEDYLIRFKGSFVSAMRWEQLDRLWQVLRERAGLGWYLYAVGEEPPRKSADAEQVEHFIARIDELLRNEHEEDYCGIVYADDMENPTFVKIFDPNNLGVSCGFSDNPPLPGWVMSLMPPTDLQVAMPPPNNRRRWWQKLLNTG